MWCEILQCKISSPKAIIHAYSPKCIRFSKFLPHTTSALRAPSPQGEGFDLCKSVKLRNKSECVRVTRVQFTLSVASRHLSQRERQGRVQNRQIDRKIGICCIDVTWGRVCCYISRWREMPSLWQRCNSGPVPVSHLRTVR